MTAVEWLIDRIAEVSVMEKGRYCIPYKSGTVDITELVEQAKEMEKQQIIKSILMWDVHTTLKEEDKGSMNEIEEFFAETYGSKGSDTPHVTPQVTPQVTSSQTEISDEEIEKYASDFYDNNGSESIFILGAKWYKEQLKQKL